jgi:hypothetical protein
MNDSSTRTKRVYTKKIDKININNRMINSLINNEMLVGNHSLAECCRNCKYIRGSICKRFPPCIGQTAFIQPMVQDTDWCGCFERAGK